MNLMSSAWRKTLKQADTPDFGIAYGGIPGTHLITLFQFFINQNKIDFVAFS